MISTIATPIPAFTGHAPTTFAISLDTDYPWMWDGFYIGSVYSSTPSGGGFVSVKLSNLTFQIQDSQRNFLFNDFVGADVVDWAVSSSNISTGDNRNEIFIINPEKPQPAGGSFLIQANNTNTLGNLFFEMVFTGYKIKERCYEGVAASRDLARNAVRF